MTVVMIKTGPVDPTITWIGKRDEVRVLVSSVGSRVQHARVIPTVGIPLRRAKAQPHQLVARMVSTAPMWFSVFLP